MAYDYSEDVAFANEMIAEYGRSITFSKVVDAGADASDPLADSMDADIVSPPVMAAFVEITGLRALGMSVDQVALFKNSTSVALLAPDGFTDFAQFNFLNDTDGSLWKVNATSVLKPGNTVVLYYIGVCAP